MKLSKIYSSDKFKEVIFNDGFNVVLGRVTKPKNLEKDSHNLGKSLLIEVIDFLLLKKSDKNHFLKIHKKKFKDHVFCLEIKLNNSDYLTIKRGVLNDSKISFKIHKLGKQNFIDLNKWDYDNIPIDKAREILNGFLDFNILTNWNYRKMVSYFLRGQYDYQDVFQLSKFNKSKDADWKPLVFNLLGFEPSKIIKKYDLIKELTAQKELLAELKKHLTVTPEETDKLRGVIELKEEEINQIETQIDNFNFYTKEQNLNFSLVEEVESKISELNSVEYSLSYELDSIEKSLKNVFDFDLEKVKMIFQEVKLFFPSQLSKDYEELIVFNKAVSNERSKYLKERLEEITSQKNNVIKELEHLNAEKGKMLSYLKDKDTFKKFKIYQSDLVKLKSDVVRLSEQLSGVNTTKELKNKQKDIEKIIDGLSSEIEQQRDAGNNYYSNIKKYFNYVIKEVIGTQAIISIPINASGNVEFNADIQNIEKSEITSEGKGFTYKKLLCIAFDIAILINYSNDSFFRFTYHDGALESLDNRKRIIFLNLIKKICKDFGVQYIMTLIEDDIPMVDGKKMVIEENEKSLVLSDEGDAGLLFEQSF
jgi:uncharacterized protein YydD (DUF2326 family)